MSISLPMSVSMKTSKKKKKVQACNMNSCTYLSPVLVNCEDKTIGLSDKATLIEAHFFARSSSPFHCVI